MFRRKLVFTSFTLLTLAFATFLDDPITAILPRGFAVSIIVLVLGVWAIVFSRFFGSTSMSRRQKVVGWLAMGMLFCAILATDQASPYVHRTGWELDLSWHAFWLILALAFALAARLFAPKTSLPDTHFSVESESPDHVVKVDRP
jgi:hypothetical protein